MKLLVCSLLWTFTFLPLFGQSLLISGIIDGPLPNGTPKAIEFVALSAISDLSKYGFGSANNGLGSDGEEFTFPSVSLAKGAFVYVATETTNFNTFFGFSPDYVDNAANVNGDDAIELFFNGAVVDVYGDINASGSGKNWEYTDGWSYRKNTTAISTNFNSQGWTFSGINALDGVTTNATATLKFPQKSFNVNSLGLKKANTIVKIHPNPTSKTLYLEGLKEKAVISIFSLTGQQVLRQHVKHHLDVSALVPGVYMVEVVHGENITRHKLWKR